MASYKLIYSNLRYKYYINKDGKIVRRSKNTVVELGYIDDNMELYKRLCESV